jgi:hypothetical protein|tara:strand:- start:149 stop:418 length:270 start_codon:yes stop_codon:yes gene_type:complete
VAYRPHVERGEAAREGSEHGSEGRAARGDPVVEQQRCLGRRQQAEYQPEEPRGAPAAAAAARWTEGERAEQLLCGLEQRARRARAEAAL